MDFPVIRLLDITSTYQELQPYTMSKVLQGAYSSIQCTYSSMVKSMHNIIAVIIVIILFGKTEYLLGWTVAILFSVNSIKSG